MNHLPAPIRTGALLLSLGLPGTVLAAGYQIQEQSVRGLGNAFAGGAAVAEDASTVLYNPAGLTRIDRQAALGGHVIVPRAEFEDRDSTNAIGGRPNGRVDVDGGQSAVVPNAFYANPINERLTFGFGASVLYGLTTEYPDDWIGRYHAVESVLFTVNLNPGIGYRVSDQLSLGAGISLQYAEATLSNALDFGTLGFLSGTPGTQPSVPELDGFSEVEGDDWGFGYNLGLLHEFTPDTRVGLAFRSRIAHTLKGDNRLTIPEFAVPLAGPSRTRGASADLVTPATLSLSGYHRLTPNWAIMADITWTDWSEFEEIRIRFDDGSRDSVQPERWEDSWRYSLGVDYFYNDRLTLRAGLAYDETPVPNAELRTPRIPDASRLWVAFGASYQASDNLTLDVGYVHIFVDDAVIRDTELSTGALAGVPVGSTLDGRFDPSVDILSAQLNWRF